jgi:hypothetical protein
VLQTPQFHRPPFDFLAFEQDGLTAPSVDTCWGEVVQAFVIALTVVVPDGGDDLRFKVSRQELAFHQDTVLKGQVGHDLLQIAHLPLQARHFARRAWGSVSPDKRFLPASRNSFDQV